MLAAHPMGAACAQQEPSPPLTRRAFLCLFLEGSGMSVNTCAHACTTTPQFALINISDTPPPSAPGRLTAVLHPHFTTRDAANPLMNSMFLTNTKGDMVFQGERHCNAPITAGCNAPITAGTSPSPVAMRTTRYGTESATAFPMTSVGLWRCPNAEK